MRWVIKIWVMIKVLILFSNQGIKIKINRHQAKKVQLEYLIENKFIQNPIKSLNKPSYRQIMQNKIIKILIKYLIINTKPH